MAYWQQLRGLQDPISIRQFRGVYKPDDEGFALDDGFATDGYNLSYLSYPALGIRPGYSLLGAAFPNRIQGIGSWKQAELHAITNGTWQRWTGGAWSQIASGLSASADPSFTNFQGDLSAMSLFMANGVDQMRYWNGTSVLTNSAAPAGANYVCQHDNRLYVAKDNTISYSALRKPLNFSAAGDAGQIVVETTTGETICGMIAGPKRLTIFKPNAIFDLFGNGPKEYTLVQATNDLGAVNNKSIITIGSVIYFLHTTGIYVYSGAARPRRDFSMPVLNYVRRINQAALNKCSMGTDGKNLYVSIPLDGATEADTILEYNSDFEVWNVWKGYSPTMFQNINLDMYVGNVDGSVRKVGGTTDNGAPIPWKWVSKPFAEASIPQRKTWYNVWSVNDIPAGSSLNVSLSKSTKGDSDWSLIKSITGSAGFTATRVIVPTISFANSPFLRMMLDGIGPVKTYEIDRQLRIMPMR